MWPRRGALWAPAGAEPWMGVNKTQCYLRFCPGTPPDRNGIKWVARLMLSLDLRPRVYTAQNYHRLPLQGF